MIIPMAAKLIEIVSSGAALADTEIEEMKSIIRDLRGSGDSLRLAELAVVWVGKNTKPVPLKETAYKR